MAETAPSPAGPPCPACGFINAGTVPYCQDCGAKLPTAAPSYLSSSPSAVAAETAAAPGNGKSPAAKKPRILSANRTRPPIVALAGITLRTVLYAAVFAGLIQLFRAPRDLPPPAPAMASTVIEQVRGKFTQSVARGIPVEAPWASTNGYLAGVLIPANGAASTFVRAVVTPRPNGFAFTTEKKIAGYLAVYTTIEYEVVARSNGLSLEPTGGAIGRVPVPAVAAPILTIIGGDVSGALKFELDLLRNARNVHFSASSARLIFSPARP